MKSRFNLPAAPALLILLVFMIAVVATQFIAPQSYAAIEAVEFDDPETLKRYQALVAELRCLVCQNQNLADSDADLAKDLRRKTEEMLKAGQSDQDILNYMRERYGDFILYRPPLTSATSLLWLGPFALLIIAVATILLAIRRKQKTPTNNNDGDQNKQQLKKVRDLLDN